jgi:two-component system cell cycle response regulator DivK
MTKVLVVEDNDLNMELVVEVLESEGFTAEKANSGEEAINKTEKIVYDLILMDISLPGIDGVKTAMIIKNRSEYRDVPVIALTAFAMKGDKERLLESGFEDYIPKPINLSEFKSKILKYRKIA